MVKENCGLGRSRAYELLSIADGKTTAEDHRERAREGMRQTRSVRNVTDSDEGDQCGRRRERAPRDERDEDEDEDESEFVAEFKSRTDRNTRGFSVSSSGLEATRPQPWAAEASCANSGIDDERVEGHRIAQPGLRRLMAA